MKFTTLHEVRKEYRDNLLIGTMLQAGVMNAWQDWIDCCYAYNSTFNWHDFFDGCFVTQINANRIVLTINRPEYFHMREVDWVTEALEHTFFIVFHIPLFVQLETTEGLA